ncbi:MAG: PorT family protein [Bacteroidales bacterium]|jgi:hypothetical protein|nr:PorT family protein [Bacteroidales bacterium]
MKKIFTTLTLFIAMTICLNANAQNQFANRMSFGARIGGNLSNFYGKNVDTKMQFGFNAALVAEYSINKFFALAIEPGYSLERIEMLDESFNSTVIKGKMDINYNLNFINIPVLLKFYPIGELYIQVGPKLGINIYSSQTIKTNINIGGMQLIDDNSTRTEEMDANEDYNLFVLGADFGIGYAFENLFIDFRYNLGLTPFNYHTQIYNIKNNNLSLNIGWMF